VTPDARCLSQRLFERKQMLGLPRALQALGDLIGAGAHTHVLHLSPPVCVARAMIVADGFV
jgi:hypothetical protein